MDNVDQMIDLDYLDINLNLDESISTVTHSFEDMNQIGGLLGQLKSLL